MPGFNVALRLLPDRTFLKAGWWSPPNGLQFKIRRGFNNSEWLSWAALLKYRWDGQALRYPRSKFWKLPNWSAITHHRRKRGMPTLVNRKLPTK